ncbi:hypothetical protein MRB53_041681 [Persea americana]|nr:hypothetical protein MRB53_041681 [Persea americana]
MEKSCEELSDIAWSLSALVLARFRVLWNGLCKSVSETSYSITSRLTCSIDPAVIAKLWDGSYLKFDGQCVMVGNLHSAISTYGNITLDNNGEYSNPDHATKFIHDAIFDNTWHLMIPAEVFPTRFRCTCYGIAAASGKLGAIIVSAIPWGKPDSSDGDTTLIGLLSSFAVVAAIGSFTTWLLTPNAQNDRENLTLEQLTDDSDLVPRDGEEDDVDSSEKARPKRQARWWYLCF